MDNFDTLYSEVMLEMLDMHKQSDIIAQRIVDIYYVLYGPEGSDMKDISAVDHAISRYIDIVPEELRPPVSAMLDIRERVRTLIAQKN